MREKYFSLHKGPYTREDAYEVATKNLKVRQSRLNNLVEILYEFKRPGTGCFVCECSGR